MTVFDVRRRFVDRPTFCVSLYIVCALTQKRIVCEAILCIIYTHTNTCAQYYIYIENSVELSLSAGGA